ncbi:MAG: methyltransferase [Actinomycetota bacterium]
MAGHYFSEQPDVASEVRRVPLHLPDVSMDLEADRGVFSADQIDSGTRVLLLEACRPVAGQRVLDVGCGYGPIACTAATRCPDAEVWAVDVNERARTLTASNAERLGIDVRVEAPDDVAGDIRFDLIVSNPPIRIGKANLHALLARWLGQLAPNGRAELVVQKHLGSDSLAKWLNAQGWPTERLLSRGGYRILVSSAKTDAT